MDEEPKNTFPAPPCKTCGPTNWNPQQTRRDVLKNVAKAGTIVALSAAIFISADNTAQADDSYAECLFDVGYQYGLDVAACNRKPIRQRAACQHAATSKMGDGRKNCKTKYKHSAN